MQTNGRAERLTSQLEDLLHNNQRNGALAIVVTVTVTAFLALLTVNGVMEQAAIRQRRKHDTRALFALTAGIMAVITATLLIRSN